MRLLHFNPRVAAAAPPTWSYFLIWAFIQVSITNSCPAGISNSGVRLKRLMIIYAEGDTDRWVNMCLHPGLSAGPHATTETWDTFGGKVQREVNIDHIASPPPNKSKPIATDVLSRMPRSGSDYQAALWCCLVISLCGRKAALWSLIQPFNQLARSSPKKKSHFFLTYIQTLPGFEVQLIKRWFGYCVSL